MGLMFSLPIIHSFRFCQMCMKCWNIPMETHKSLVNLLKMFNAVPHCLEILFTNMTIENRSMWLSMWNAMSCQICEKYFKNNWEWPIIFVPWLTGEELLFWVRVDLPSRYCLLFRTPDRLTHTRMSEVLYFNYTNCILILYFVHCTLTTYNVQCTMYIL